MPPRRASDHTVLVVWVGGHFVTHSVRCGWVEPVEAGSDPFRVPGQDAGWVYPNKQNCGPHQKGTPGEVSIPERNYISPAIPIPSDCMHALPERQLAAFADSALPLRRCDFSDAGGFLALLAARILRLL
mgnify:CR=1 FL=1